MQINKIERLREIKSTALTTANKPDITHSEYLHLLNRTIIELHDRIAELEYRLNRKLL